MATDGFDYERLYDRLAPIYSLIWTKTRHLALTRRALPWLEGRKRVLELGPGPGVVHGEIASGRPLAVGLDISREMLARARTRLLDAGLRPNLVRGDAVEMPFVDEAFDAVVGTFVFSAIPDGLGALREIRRVLARDGLIVLVDAGQPSDGNLGGRLLARLWTLFGDHLRDEAALMRRVGLEVIEREEFGVFGGIRLVVGRKPRAGQ